jgi:hypothetical protein
VLLLLLSGYAIAYEYWCFVGWIRHVPTVCLRLICLTFLQHGKPYGSGRRYDRDRWYSEDGEQGRGPTEHAISDNVFVRGVPPELSNEEVGNICVHDLAGY